MNHRDIKLRLGNASDGLLDAMDSLQKAQEYVDKALSDVENSSQSELSCFQPFAPQIIILRDGRRMPFSEWQKSKGLSKNRFSKYFSFSDAKLNRRDFQLSELLFIVLDEFRKCVGKPVRINSGYRSQTEQDDLIARGFRAVKHSPHTEGMAIDIDTTSRAETFAHVKILEQVSKDLGIKIRIGYQSYLKKGQTFIHLDVCPMFFAEGMPFHHLKHPSQWEREARW